MSSKAFKVRGVVLRKTKLGEKDLIITFLREDGSLGKAVAKGARKPGGSYAAKLELFGDVNIELASGRSLDVITGASFADEPRFRAFGVEQAACAAPLAELLCTIAQEDLPQDRLFAMTSLAFRFIGASSSDVAPAYAAAALLKAFAMTGFRPSFDSCIFCGAEALKRDDEPVVFSFIEGGAVCDACQAPSDFVSVDSGALRWAYALMMTRFQDIVALKCDVSTSFSVLHLARQWARVHVGKNLKSLDFLFASGLF